MTRMLPVILLVIGTLATWAEGPPNPPLSVGFETEFRWRLPLEEFAKTHVGLALEEVAFPRNVQRCFESPLPLAHTELPGVFFVTAGAMSDDVRSLAERRLIAPVDSMLVDLGMAREDFREELLAAFTYDKFLYAIPHHVILPTLRFNRSVFESAGTLPASTSWEELLATAETLLAKRGEPGPRRLFSSPYTRARLAELIALSAGAPPLDLANPTFITSAPFQKALQLVIEAVQKNRIHLQDINTPLRADGGIILGIDLVSSVQPDSEFGVAEMPARVYSGDTPAATPRVPAVAEGLALRNFSPADRPAALEFTQWLFSPETEWRVFELSNPREPSKERLIDTVHVPLRASALTSIDFEYADKKFPDFGALRAHIAKAYFSRQPAALEARVWELIEAKVDYLRPDEELPAALAALEAEIRELVRTTPVASAAYEEY